MILDHLGDFCIYNINYIDMRKFNVVYEEQKRAFEIKYNVTSYNRKEKEIKENKERRAKAKELKENIKSERKLNKSK